LKQGGQFPITPLSRKCQTPRIIGKPVKVDHPCHRDGPYLQGRCAKSEKTVISERTVPVVQESHGSRLEPKTQKLSEVFEAPWTDPLQLEAIHSRLWDTVHPLLPALGDEFRLWSLFIRLGVDVTLVEDIRAMKVSELRPTAIAVIVVPIIAWSVVLDESKNAPLQPLQAIESPVG